MVGPANVTDEYVVVNGLADAERCAEVLDRKSPSTNSLADTAIFVEHTEMAWDFVNDEAEVIETPSDVLGGSLLDEDSLGDAVTFIELEESAWEAYKSKAAVEKARYGKQMEAVSPAGEARLHKKIKCIECVNRVHQHVWANLGQLDERRLCRRCRRLTL